MATESDSYCVLADIEAHAQMGVFSNDSYPNEDEVVDFAAGRAGELYGILTKFMGDDAYGPDSFTRNLTTPDGDVQKALKATLVLYNAIGASIDALSASGSSESPARSERVAELSELYANAATALEPLARVAKFSNSASRASTHISSGEITKKAITSREEAGLVVTDQKMF